MRRHRALAAAAVLALWAAAAAAQGPGVTLAGRMGERALLVIDGSLHTVAPGQTAGGVRLLRWAGDSVEVERDGRLQVLRLGGVPAQVGAAPPPAGGRAIVIPVAPDGHFVTAGAINGRATRFMVDTGATLVSIGRPDAERLGLDLAGARRAVTQTANGAIPVQTLTLATLRVGEVELNNVNAVVLPGALPYVLLGNSFLGRFQMRRDNDVMHLELR